MVLFPKELADDGDDDDITEGPSSPPSDAPHAGDGAGLELPPPDREPRHKPSEDDEVALPGGATPPPTPQPKPPIAPPPLPPADPKPPIIDDPPVNPGPPTIIDPPTGPTIGTGITTSRRNPPRQSSQE